MALFGPSRKQVARRLISGFNAGDVELVDSSITDDFRFIDSGEGVIAGRDDFLEVYDRFTELVPRFTIHVETISEQGVEVYVRGRIETDEPEMARDTHWRVVVREDRVCEWQNYTRAEPVPFALLMGYSSSAAAD